MASKLPLLKPKFAIQYDPGDGSLQLAIGYVRLPRYPEQGIYDLYGFLAGDSGGGCYSDEFFHAEEQGGVFVTYSSTRGSYWHIDHIGDAGLEGMEVEPAVLSILESVQDSVFERWLMWTDDGIVDLQESAKQRLNCSRRRVFWVSRGFKYQLLEFLSQEWPMSLSFG